MAASLARIQLITDNGAVYAAAKTIDMGLALNLEPCFTPAERTERDSMASGLVKTFKRDIVRVNPSPGRGNRHHRRRVGLDGGRQHRPSPQPTRMPLTT